MTQVVKIHQRTLKEHWDPVSQTNPDIFKNGYFFSDLWPLCRGKRLLNNTFSVSGFSQRARRRRRQRERQTQAKQAKQQLCTCITLFYFFAVVARLRLESTIPNFTFWGGRDHKTTISFFFSWTSMQSFSIHLQKKSPTFVELNEMK